MSEAPGAAGYAPEAPAPAPLMGPWQPGASVPMTSDEKSRWDKDVERAHRKAKRFHPQWKRALDRYAKALVQAKRTDVNALKDYAHVETKKAQLFHRTPEVTLLPVDPQDPTVPYLQVLPYRQKVLNYELGPKKANAKRALHKSLVETLASSGFMAVKLGYEQAALPVPGQMGPDGKPVTVPIWSRRFIEPVDSDHLLIPASFKDTSNYDAAPWLGMRGRMPHRIAKRIGWMFPPDYEPSQTKTHSDYEDAEDVDDAAEGQCEYTEVWYRAHLYDDAVWHPELLRCLILVDGVEVPVWHVNSPHQTLTPTGQLTDDSMIGFPIHVGTIRDLPKSGYVPSDLVVGEQLSEELNQFRTDLIRNRKSRAPIELISDAAGDVVAEKIRKERVAIVPSVHVREGGTTDLVAVIQAGSEPRDNFTAQDYIERDRELALGASANQSGQLAQQKRTATEVRQVAGNSSARAQTEQDRIREYFIGLVQKFDAVVQQTMTPVEVQTILGQQGAMLWGQWQALPGRYHYDIMPDSGRYLDPQQHRAEVVDLYNMTRKDDRVNPEELLTMLAQAFHRDPAKLIAPPSGKTMEPPKPSVSFTVEDFHDPLGGQTFLELLKAGGVQISPELEMLFKAAAIVATVAGNVGGKNPDGTPSGAGQHAGTADKTEPVNQHQRQNTGGVQGVGRKSAA